jgi:hypothetical protein
MEKIKKIIFIDSRKEAQVYRANAGKGTQRPEQDGGLIIAMNPSANVYLKKRGDAACNTMRYFTTASHEMVLKKSYDVMKWFRTNIEFLDFGVGVSELYYNAFNFYTRFAIHYFLWVIEVVLNAVQIHDPETLAALMGNDKKTENPYMDCGENYMGRLVHAIAIKEGLKFESMSNTMSFECAGITSLWKSLKFILKYVDFRLQGIFLVKEGQKFSQRPIIATSNDGQAKRLLEKLQKELQVGSLHILRGPVTLPFSKSNFCIKAFCKKYYDKINKQRKLFDDLKNKIKEEKTLFSYRDISFAEAISQKLEGSIYDYVLGEILWSLELNRFFEKTRPIFILSSGNRLDDAITAEFCQRTKTTGIMISHGSLVTMKNDYERIEWEDQGRTLLGLQFPFLVLQTPLAEGYLSAFPSKSRIVRTGPLTWGNGIDREKSRELFKKMFKDKYCFGETKVVLHAGTPKSSKTLRPYVYETPDEYIEAISNLAQVVEKIDGVVLIVRFRQIIDLSIDDLKELVPFSNKVILNTTGSFIDVLGISDLLASFSSTTIEEAFQNKIPVLLYGGKGRYRHVPAHEVRLGEPVRKSAVYHVQETAHLEYAINGILDLNINKTEHEDLFRQYIYAEESRTSIVDLIRTQK